VNLCDLCGKDFDFAPERAPKPAACNPAYNS
jgi:hypothetical protein